MAFLLLFAAAAPASRAAAASDPPDPPRRASPPTASDAPDPPRRAAPPTAIALVAGIATAILPVAFGAMHAAGAGFEADGPRNVGFAVAGVGLALSPIAAHVVLGEWKRAAAFGAVPVASEIAICSFLAARPESVFHGTMGSRTAFALLFSADVFGAALGLVDVMMAGERARSDTTRASSWTLHGLTVAPNVGQGRAGLVLGGIL